MHQRHVPEPSEKVNLGPLEKVDTIPKIILDKFESVDFKYDNSFLKLQPKNTQIGHLWPQI